MFGGCLYACGGTSLVLVHCVAPVIVVNNAAHTCSALPGVSRHAQYMVLLTCSRDKPPWLRTPCSLTLFSPSHSQVMGKKESRHPPCLAAVCESSELHRRGWRLQCGSSSCKMSLTAWVELWVTGCERPQTWDIKVSFMLLPGSSRGPVCSSNFQRTPPYSWE